MKQKHARQTICDEPTGNEKNPFCGGKLKLVSELEPELKKQAGPNIDVFRCRICKTLYSFESPFAVAKR